MFFISFSGKKIINTFKSNSIFDIAYNYGLLKSEAFNMNIDPYTINNGENYVQMSQVPDICKLKPCVLGIDEAGR